MKHIRALIVDDLALARSSLRRLLEAEKDFALVGECEDGQSALQSIHRHRPDLVFLDIGLPDMNGFEVLKELPGDSRPAVIFVTASDHYAVPAFAANAVDYLLKPFTVERFREALGRARNRLADPRPASAPAKSTARGNDIPVATEPVLSLKVGRSFVIVRAEEIEAIVVSRAHSLVFTQATSHRTRRALTALKEKLPPGKFVRINRSTLVNAGRIKEIIRKAHGDGVVRLSSGREFTLARRWRAQWSGLVAA